MPSALATVLIHPGEPVEWRISDITALDPCGHKFHSAETHDKTIGLSGSLEDMRRLGESLIAAIDQYTQKEAVHG